ncbi:putative 1,3-beta-glucan synthase [Rosa chinensis]|uniref:Putative 1,3-beta-glucan synthase n=1 Tax=Rosa chinensis TaxID=74649 RepID=A0A2P6QMU2_ROSCH|nr:putative 1,3-beta-glucan synthase [Rosa chinensis]
MAQVEERWERLVRAVLRRERMGPDAYEQHGTGIAGNVLSSLENNKDIDEILRVADEIQDEDPNISRIRMLLFVLFFYLFKFFSSACVKPADLFPQVITHINFYSLYKKF